MSGHGIFPTLPCKAPLHGHPIACSPISTASEYYARYHFGLRDPIPERSHNKNGHGEIFGPLGNNEFKLKLRSELVSPPLSPPPPAQSYNLAFYPL